MKKLILLLFMLSCIVPLWGKPKPATREYPFPCGQVWLATRDAVKNHYDVLNLSDAERAGSFTTGSIWTGVRPLTFALSEAGRNCVVSVTGHFSGITHNDKGDFFDRIQTALKAQSAALGVPANAEKDFNRYFRQMDHKAFAVSVNGHYGYSYGRADEDQASTKALEFCSKYAKDSPCKLILVDNRIK